MLSVGSIGTLIATNLAQVPASKVRLILRRKDLAGALYTSQHSKRAILTPDEPSDPLISLRLERDGLVKRTDGFEVEITQSPEDRLQSTLSPGDKGVGNKSTKLPSLVRNDPIDALIITTKAPQTFPALQPFLPRLTASSTIMLCQNGMGVLEGMLEQYWPEENTSMELGSSDAGPLANYGTGPGRPSFICATTTHGVWRKNASHFVHAGMGDLKFGVVPNRAVLASIQATNPSPWGEHRNNPLLNPRSLITPTLDHLPLTPTTRSLHTTLSTLLQTNLFPSWLPLPTLQIVQLQKLAVNASVNALTAVLGVHNGGLVGSKHATRLIDSISRECSSVFAAHLAREAGTWKPPPLPAKQYRVDSPLDSDPRSTSSPSSSAPTAPWPLPPALPDAHPLSPASLTANTISVVMRTSVNLSSTLQDLLATSKTSSAYAPTAPTRTEVDYINGYVVALGERYRIDTPITASFGALVKLKEEMLRSGAIDQVVITRAEELRFEDARRTMSNSPYGSVPIFKLRPTSGSREVDGAEGEAMQKRRMDAHERAREQSELRRQRRIVLQDRRKESFEDNEAIRRARS